MAAMCLVVARGHLGWRPHATPRGGLTPAGAVPPDQRGRTTCVTAPQAPRGRCTTRWLGPFSKLAGTVGGGRATLLARRDVIRRPGAASGAGGLPALRCGPVRRREQAHDQVCLFGKPAAPGGDQRAGPAGFPARPGALADDLPGRTQRCDLLIVRTSCAVPPAPAGPRCPQASRASRRPRKSPGRPSAAADQHFPACRIRPQPAARISVHLGRMPPAPGTATAECSAPTARGWPSRSGRRPDRPGSAPATGARPRALPFISAAWP